MIQIGAFQAKTHFSEILRQVEQGEEYCITNRGKVVAVITAPETDFKRKALEAFTKLQALRAKHSLGTVKEISLWKDKGRR